MKYNYDKKYLTGFLSRLLDSWKTEGTPENTYHPGLEPIFENFKQLLKVPEKARIVMHMIQTENRWTLLPWVAEQQPELLGKGVLHRVFRDKLLNIELLKKIVKSVPQEFHPTPA